MATSGKVAKVTEHAGAAGASYCDAQPGGVNWSPVLSFLIINCLALLVVSLREVTLTDLKAGVLQRFG
jgi:hypothetical protein